MSYIRKLTDDWIIYCFYWMFGVKLVNVGDLLFNRIMDCPYVIPISEEEGKALTCISLSSIIIMSDRNVFTL